MYTYISTNLNKHNYYDYFLYKKDKLTNVLKASEKKRVLRKSRIFCQSFFTHLIISILNANKCVALFCFVNYSIKQIAFKIALFV